MDIPAGEAGKRDPEDVRNRNPYSQDYDPTGSLGKTDFEPCSRAFWIGFGIGFGMAIIVFLVLLGTFGGRSFRGSSFANKGPTAWR